MQTAIRQLRIEGATLLYIHKLCNIFFTSVMETAKEFEMNFAGNTGCYSSFVVWSLAAMGMFVDAFSKQVGRQGLSRRFHYLKKHVVSSVFVQIFAFRKYSGELTDGILSCRQVFDSKESLSTAAECVKVAKEHCQQLTEIGVDLTFTLQSLLVKDVKAALLSYKDIIIEATKHRNSEEMWRRMNLMTPEALAKLKVHVLVFNGPTQSKYLIFCWRINTI